jgi:DNA-binding MarR family transcriptional regulator
MWTSFTHLVDEVRLTHHRLVALADTLHAEAGVTAPMRAVLEYLTRRGPTAVPDIARSRGVTRQHIQAIVNDLEAAGFVERQANPAHARSALVELTPAGRDAVAAVFERERAVLRPRLEGLVAVDADDLDRAAAVLLAVRTALDAARSDALGAALTALTPSAGAALTALTPSGAGAALTAPDPDAPTTARRVGGAEPEERP